MRLFDEDPEQEKFDATQLNSLFSNSLLYEEELMSTAVSDLKLHEFAKAIS